MTVEEVFSQFIYEFDVSSRKFSAGLLVSFIDFYMELGVPGSGFMNLEDVLHHYPRREITAAGKRANTLIVETGDDNRAISLRPFYNRAESYFRAEKKRFDYPSCAPHAT